jgi:xylose isomerase
MAVTKTILKKAKHEVVVKFANDSGNAQTSIFDLDVDALLSTEVIEGTVKVNIVEIHWAGLAGSHFHLERNSVRVFAAQGSDADQFVFSGFVDGVENTSDLTISMHGEIYVYVVLRKNSGFETKIETAQFGSYDNPAARGS